MHPVITIFCAFTRRWAVDRWLDNLSKCIHDPALTNLVVVIDIDEPYIKNTFERYAKEKGYRSFHFRMNTEWHPNEVRLAIRRLRIAEVKNQSKDLIAKCDGDIVVGFEDDTVFQDAETIRNLLAPFKWFRPPGEQPIGFVEGVQCGRWGVKMIGAWKADDPIEPTHVETLLPETGYKPIDAGGFYGYATLKSLYLQHEYYSASSQPYGPDVNYGLWVRSKGYACLVDWDTIFLHNDHNKLIAPDDSLSTISYTKESNGKWDRRDTDRNG